MLFACSLHALCMLFACSLHAIANQSQIPLDTSGLGGAFVAHFGQTAGTMPVSSSGFNHVATAHAGDHFHEPCHQSLRLQLAHVPL
eukprot:Skav210307  [mRNA]  locus=scaffold475:213830:215120:+ [translate_table: standard]